MLPSVFGSSDLMDRQTKLRFSNKRREIQRAQHYKRGQIPCSVSVMLNADTTVNNVQDHVPPAQVFSQSYCSPFGSFPLPVASKSQSLPRSANKNFRKTIIVVSLLKRDVRNQPCSSKTGSLDYNVVSHIVVNLEQSMCNVGSVASALNNNLESK